MNNIIGIKRIVELLNEEKENIAKAKQKQAAYWRLEGSNNPPVIAYFDLTPEQEKIPSPNLKQAFYNSEMMLFHQIRSVFSALNSGSDVVPSIRANMGVGVILSLLGGSQIVFEDKMPWPKEHFSKKRLYNFSVEDIQLGGDFELGLRHMRFFREVLGNTVPIYCMDHQGPFDLAHLLFGDQIFIEIFDDPDFVHYLLNLCVEISVKAIEIMKEISGEKLNECYHSNMIYADNMGIRICEDTSALLGPEQIAEFVIPYTAKLARHFGGGWVHYCGRNDNLTKQICAIPEIKGINFGVIPGKEYEHEFEKDMECCLNSKTIYVGFWTPYPNETAKEFVKRMHFWAKQGAMIPVMPNSKEKYGMNSREMVDYFRELG